MTISDLKRIIKDWNSVWKMILTYHRFSMDESRSPFMKSFLSEFTIADVYYREKYTEDEEEERDCYPEYTTYEIRFTTKEKDYKIVYETYMNSYDAYEPDFFIYEIEKAHETEHTIDDFFEMNHAADSTNIFYKCMYRLFQEIEHEYNSELRYWELNQHKKENHRMYGKNKLKKRFK